MPSKLVSLIYIPNSGTNFAIGDVPLLLWEQGWAAWYAQSQIPRQLALGVTNFDIHAPFGVRAPQSGAVSGHTPEGGAVKADFLGPRECALEQPDARLVDGRPELGQPSFVDFWTAKVAEIKALGGRVFGYIGPPPLTTPRDNATLDAWSREIEQAGMVLGYDTLGAHDRLSYATPASLMADRLVARGRSVSVEPLWPSSPKLTRWLDGRFSYISDFNSVDNAIGSPSGWSVPYSGQTVWAFANGGTPAPTRAAKALGYFGQRINGAPLGVLMEMGDFADSAVRTMVAAAA